VFDDECSTFDTTKWTANEGGSQNGITSHASNITATENGLLLTLASSTSGANISTTNYGLEIGHCTEALITLPGNGTAIPNWGAFCLGTANESNSVEIPGVWAGSEHTYAVLRTTTKIYEYYWDGKLVHTFAAYDGELNEPQPLVLTMGYKSGRGALLLGAAGGMLVRYVRAWAPA
jgi:hypothetical protein